jgi:hypothetical protein
MVALVASVMLQLKVELSPALIVGGLAKNELMIGLVGVILNLPRFTGHQDKTII